MQACVSCGRPTDRPRRGRCPACYRRAQRGHAVAKPCAVCGIADLRVLRRHKLRDGFVVLCANHAAIAGRRSLTLTELRGECAPPGDRRAGAERRQADRRHVERRRAPAPTPPGGVERRATERRTKARSSRG